MQRFSPLLLVLATASACGDEPARDVVLPSSVGPWERLGTGPSYLTDGVGTIPFTEGTAVVLRADVTWPADAEPYEPEWTLSPMPIEGATLEVTSNELRLTISAWQDANVPVEATACSGRTCETYGDLGAIALRYAGGPTTAIAVPSVPLTIGVGERRPWQALPLAAIPDLPEGTEPEVGAATGYLRSTASLTYRTSDPGVATVTQRGVVVGTREGTATITVSAGDVSDQFEVTVTDTPPAAPFRVAQPLSDSSGWWSPRDGALSADDRPVGTLSPDHDPLFVVPSSGDLDGQGRAVTGGTLALVRWTGTGYGIEWPALSPLEHNAASAFGVDGDGTEYLAFVDTTDGLAVEIWHRDGIDAAWTKSPLPIRPDLDAGAEIPRWEIGDFGQGARVVPTVRTDTAGAWVAYQMGVRADVVGRNAQRYWASEQGCTVALRLAHVTADGIAEVEELDAETSATCGEVDDVVPVNTALHVFLDEEGEPEVFRSTDGGDFDRFTRDGQGWSRGSATADEVAALQDPQPLPYASEGRVFDLIAAVVPVEEAHADAGREALVTVHDRIGAGGLYLDGGTLVAAAAPAIDLRHDLEETVGRRIGEEAGTPTWAAGPFATAACEAFIDGDGAAFVRPDSSASWVPADASWPAAVFAADADAVYAIMTSESGVTVSRTTDCVAFSEGSTAPLDGADQRLVAARVEGDRVWAVLVPPALDAIALVRWNAADIAGAPSFTSSPLTPPEGVGAPMAMGLDALEGDPAVLLTAGDLVGDIRLSRLNGAVSGASWYETDGTWAFGTHQALAFADGWLLPADGVDGVALVRTADFADVTEVLPGAVAPYPSGDSPMLGASPVRLPDGRLVATGSAPDDAPNRTAAWFATSDDDGATWTEPLFFRPWGGNSQRPQSVYVAPSGAVGVWLEDSGVYAADIPYPDRTVPSPEAVTQELFVVEEIPDGSGEGSGEGPDE